MIDAPRTGANARPIQALTPHTTEVTASPAVTP